jgi:CheY-like chemotaxis protein
VVTDLADAPPVALDETRLGQVLVNLLINAAHAIPPGDLERNEVAMKVWTDAETRVVIEVRDTGCGMTPDVLKRAFEPFFTTKTSGLGSGLGLSICHGIVTSIGGKVEAESRHGSGSVLRVVLPSAVAAKGATEQQPVAHDCKQRGRVLIVDDEALVRRAVGRVLKDHDLVEVGDAREALRLLEDGEVFDVILSDLIMPQMTGMEFYEELLRKRPADAHRIVFLTGGALIPRISDFLAAVPNPYLEKPFDVERLKSTVQQVLGSYAIR